jgi:hypothetical protein
LNFNNIHTKLKDETDKYYKIKGYIEENTENLKKIETKKRKDSWTFSQSLEHITKSENYILNKLITAIDNQNKVRFNIKFFLAKKLGILDKPRIKVKTRKDMFPDEVSLEIAMKNFEQQRNETLKYIHSLDQSLIDLLSKIGSKYPFIGKISALDLIDMMANHQKRHLDQFWSNEINKK